MLSFDQNSQLKIEKLKQMSLATQKLMFLPENLWNFHYKVINGLQPSLSVSFPLTNLVSKDPKQANNPNHIFVKPNL